MKLSRRNTLVLLGGGALAALLVSLFVASIATRAVRDAGNPGPEAVAEKGPEPE